MATGTGNLPYPGKVYVPFDILTAQELNEDVANIESLATGTGIGDEALDGSVVLQDNSVTSQKLKSTVSFFAYKSSSQVTSNSTFRVNFDAELYDKGSNYDNATNYRFVAPVAGIYSLKSTISCGNASSMRLTPHIYKNNGTIRVQGKTIDTTFVSSSVEAEFELAANDYAEVFITTSNVAGINTGTTPIQSFFCGYLVGRV